MRKSTLTHAANLYTIKHTHIHMQIYNTYMHNAHPYMSMCSRVRTVHIAPCKHMHVHICRAQARRQAVEDAILVINAQACTC